MTKKRYSDDKRQQIYSYAGIGIKNIGNRSNKMSAQIVRSYATTLTLILLVITGTALGQAPGTGAITGTVYDPSGSTVSGATVSVTSDSTGLERTIISASTGTFTVPLLSPGSYTVKVSASGFNVSAVHAVSVVVSETSAVELHLSIASANVSVEVKPSIEMAQLESSTLGRALNQQMIEAIPLSSRNFTQILALSPGVVVALPDATALGKGTQDVTANGNKPTANNIQFNGIDANNLAQNSASNAGEEVGVAIPAPDTIEEFKVQTGNYDATYGRGTGANVDVISRGGSNRFHGTAWEFLRNDALNANDFFSKLAGQPRPVLKQNQFGGAFGGPILRNRLFFFGAYQGLRSSNGLGNKVTAVLPQLTADRSAATLGAQFCHYATFAGGTQVACDGSNINPVALALLNFKFPNGQFAIPSPQINLPVTDPTQIPIGESTYAIPASYSENQYTANIDETISRKNNLSGRFFYSRAPTDQPFSPNAANVPGWGTKELDQNAMLVLADTHVFSSSLVNIARFGYMRFDGVSAVASPILASDLGTQSPTGLSGGQIPAPGITVDGLFTIGDAGTPSQSQVTNGFIWQDTVAHTHGHHSMRMGVEAKRLQVMATAPFSTDGLLDIHTLNDFLLGLNAVQNGSPQGFSNVTTSGGSSGLFRKDTRYSDLAIFFQDDIKLTPALTVNTGLRYEIFGVPSDIHGRMVTFDPQIASLSAPTSGTLSGFVVPSNYTGPVPAGVIKSSISGLWPTRHLDVSPRVGFALRIANRPTMVLRGGFGIYFDRLSGGLAESLIAQEPFSTQSFSFGAANGGASLQQPFSPLLPPQSSYPLFIPRIPGGGPSISAVSRNITDPYTEEYNLNGQIAFARDYLFEVGYVGNRTLHAAGSIEFNQAQLASPSNPISGETTNSANNVVQRLPYAGVSPGSLNSQTRFISNYNSLQSSLTRRLGHGLQFLGSYTWSKNLNQTSGSSGSEVYELWLVTNDQSNPRQAYGPTDFDRPHRAVLSLTYSTPHTVALPALLSRAFASWQISLLFVAQSGTPITILDNAAGSVYGNYPFENRAQLSGSNPYTTGSMYARVLSRYLSPAAFAPAPQAPFATGPGDTDFGNSGVGMVRGPGQRNLDLALERTISVTESQSFRARAEFFNLTNTTNFGNPSNTVGTPGFGVITTTAHNPRVIQLALKYQF
jgi:hypothetical protein